jgi:N-acetylneuraminate synthase
VYFAFPCNNEGQMASGEWREGMESTVSIIPDIPLMRQMLANEAPSPVLALKSAIHEVKAQLAYAGVTLGHQFTTEYSHHYGIERFREVGAVLITVINREYAKKLIVQLPGQFHPWHYHKLKEETFHVMWGDLEIQTNDRWRTLRPGDTLTILPGVWHRFSTKGGVVFEEISTTAHKGDSVYRDPAINTMTTAERKTIVDHWGRFQIGEQTRAVAAE